MNVTGIQVASQGLLTTVGPALAQGFTTNSFLNAFEPVPGMGSVIVPSVVDGKIVSVTMNDAQIDAMESTVGAVISEAQDVREGVSKWDPRLPTPLDSTEGHWTLFPKHGSGDDYIKDGFVFKSKFGRHISFQGFRNSIGIGRSGKYASYYQNVYIEPDDYQIKRVYTQNYWMAFLGDGMNALARFLGMESAPMVDIALAVANRIYFSGQFESEHLLDPPRAHIAGKECDLESDDGQWTFPGAPDQFRGIALAREEGVHGTSLPIHIRLGSDRILIGIHRRNDNSQPLMPLSADLLPLWEGARLLANADPDDGDYLVKIM